MVFDHSGRQSGYPMCHQLEGLHKKGFEEKIETAAQSEGYEKSTDFGIGFKNKLKGAFR